MGKIKFDRPIGAKADFEELLYITTLHQSPVIGTPIREDASIIDSDIVHFLLSRHGVEVTDKVVQDIILAGFEDKSRLDLVETVTLLFIPQLYHIAQAVKEGKVDQDGGGVGIGSDKEDEEMKLHVTTNPHIIKFILEAILFDTTGDKDPKALTTDLIRDIFHKYGEDGISDNDPILMEMMEAARGTGKDNDGKPILLDENTFLRLLTHDIEQYGKHEELTSSYFGGVFGNDNSTYYGTHTIPTTDGVFEHDEADKNIYIHKRLKTAKGIDYIVGGYHCKYRVTAIWCSFVFGFFGFLYPKTGDGVALLIQDCPSGSFGCQMAFSAVNWIVLFGMIMLFGVSMMLSDGLFTRNSNSSTKAEKNWSHMIVTIITTAGFIAIPLTLFPFQPDVPYIFYSQLLAYGFAFYFLIPRWKDSIQSFYPKKEDPVPTVKDESFSKRAALCKIKRMQENAVQIQSNFQEKNVIKAYYGNALSNFTKLKDETEETGGVLWAWKKYRSGELFYREGIWISSRFLTSQLFQLFTCTLVLTIGISTYVNVSNSWLSADNLQGYVTELLNISMTTLADHGIVQDAANRMLQRSFAYLLQFLETLDNAGILQFDCITLSAFLIATCTEKASCATQVACNFFTAPERLCEAMELGNRPPDTVVDSSQNFIVSPVFNTTSLRAPFVNFLTNAFSDNVTLLVNRGYPEARYMVTVPTAIAVMVAFIVSLSLASMVIPSLVSTVLKFRSGMMPIMKSKNFHKYRYHTMNSTKITGGMFWSNLVASVVIGGVIWLLLFFCLWQVTRPIAAQLTASVITVYIIVIVVWLINRSFRNFAFRGFYRIKPLRANMYSLPYECLNIGLTITMAISRAIVLFFLSIFHVGRLDIPFVAEDVGDYLYHYVDLEQYNIWFNVAVLSVEAHRHPYLETLGVMYLMKLKYNNNFNTCVGIKWRTIFVTALMPWIRKYRILNTMEDRKNQSLAAR